MNHSSNILLFPSPHLSTSLRSPSKSATYFPPNLQLLKLPRARIPSTYIFVHARAYTPEAAPRNELAKSREAHAQKSIRNCAEVTKGNSLATRERVSPGVAGGLYVDVERSRSECIQLWERKYTQHSRIFRGGSKLVLIYRQ